MWTTASKFPWTLVTRGAINLHPIHPAQWNLRCICRATEILNGTALGLIWMCTGFPVMGTSVIASRNTVGYLTKMSSRNWAGVTMEHIAFGKVVEITPKYLRSCQEIKAGWETPVATIANVLDLCCRYSCACPFSEILPPVSYTHLTLPTIYSV